MKSILKNKKLIYILCAIIVIIMGYMLIVKSKTKEVKVAEETTKIEKQEELNAEAESETASTTNWNLERVNIVNDTAGIPVPVPKGYVASSLNNEHTVKTGFVIYEGTEEVNESNKNEAQKTRNQWVWVPVENANDIYGTDSQGKKHGKLYNFSSSGRTANNWAESNGVMSITSSTSYREPDVVINYNYDSYIPNYLTEETRNEINKELKENFEMTIESIKKYGGFYIGRYETGGLNGEAKVVKGDTNISSQNWYTMYEKSKELRGINSNVRTSIIWGCQWDATLEWLVKSGSKTYSEVGSDSKSWGNYKNSSFSYINSNGVQSTKNSSNSTRIPTGSTEYTKANNIYDMAGNVTDWTLEAGKAYDANYRVLRGGFCYSYGYDYTAADRNRYDPHDNRSDDSYGTRASLYVAL